MSASARGDLTADLIVDLLGMQAHPEGGYFVETWRSDEQADGRALGTAIYFLLTPEGFSAMHRLASDEIWHHYAGGAVEMLLLHPDGKGETRQLGQDLARGDRPQTQVPRGTWQGARVLGDAPWALVGCTVTPGFAFEDFALAERDVLLATWPEHAEAIRRLTR